MSTTADTLPKCAFCLKKASYIWSDGIYTCLSPLCVKQARGATLLGETDADKET